MRKIIYIIAALILLLSLDSCEKSKMVEYGEGGEINFFGYNSYYSPPARSDDEKYLVWERNFGINKSGDSLLVDTMMVGVKVMGVYADHPRKVVLKAKSTTAESLEIIFPEDYYVPADTGRAEFKILVKRPAKRNIVYKAEVEFDYAGSDFKRGTLERQIFRVECSDVVTMEKWGTDKEEWEGYYREYLGDWSETKARFIITTVGCTSISKWFASSEVEEDIFVRLPVALEEYKSNPANLPLLDENTGEWISFPELY